MIKAIVVIYDRDTSGLIQYVDDMPLVKEIQMDFPIRFHRADGEQPHIKGFIPKIYMTDIVAITQKDINLHEHSVFIHLVTHKAQVVPTHSEEYFKLENDEHYGLHYQGSLENCTEEAKYLNAGSIRPTSDPKTFRMV